MLQQVQQMQADMLKAGWRAKVSGLRNAHEVAILDSGAKFQSISIPPEDAQLLETRGFSTTEIARLISPRCSK